MTSQEFATKIRNKYPQYKNTDDTQLVDSVLKKYPQYSAYVDDQPTTVQKTEGGFLEQVGGALDTVFGGAKIGEAIGTKIAELRATPEERAAVEEFGGQTFEGPSATEVAGDVIRTGATFAPIGKIGSLAAKGIGALGLKTGAQTAGKVAAGGLTGAAADVGVQLSEGEKAELGLGAALGAGVPASSPLLGALRRATVKGTAKVGAEFSGALTGTSAETLEQAFTAAKGGGRESELFTKALRGETTPENLVQSFRNNIATVNSSRQQLFKETLDELGDVRVATDVAKQNFLQQLNQAGVRLDIENNVLDFSKSKLRTVPGAKNKVIEAWNQVYDLPPTASLQEIDTTRQAIKALELAGDDASANLGNKLVDDAVRSVRQAGEEVKGYGQMLDNFTETSEFLNELQRGLSSGDRATIDQTYRRMATALKTNNEQRMALVKELDDATGGAILSQISGQQLSEALPRGLFRQIAAGIAGTGIVTGGLSVNLIPALVFASPRVTGEFVRGLGITANKAEAIISAIEDARGVLTKIGAISGAEVD